jgi:hypothetical protein
MRGKTTLENVVSKVHEMSMNYYDESIDISEMRFEDLNWMYVGNNVFEILPSAQRLFANRLRIPHAYLARCPEELQAQNLNYWLEQEQKHRESLFCRFDGPRLRGVFTEKYTAIDHGEILNKMIEHDFPLTAEVHCSLDETLMVLKVPDYNRTFGNNNGDRIVPGISIGNSEVGILALTIEAYFYRLVCANGLIAKTAVASRFKHISRKALDEFPYVLGQVVDESRHSQHRFRISMQTAVENPLNTISSFNKQFQLTKKEAEAVGRGWEQEKGSSMFNVIQAYTRAAQDVALSTEEAYKLEKVGGEILSLVRP